MTFNYRFSVIPAGAITDARLSPRALQVLCLLGRHTNDNGWCSRSQVKMARELGCGRSTLYDAIGELFAADWIERKRNGRGGTGPEASEHPFAAFSYRVLLDRDDLPARITSDETNEGGAAIPAGGAAIPAGGAAIPAPLEGIPSEGISTEPERETRARDKGRERLNKLKSLWPTSALDDQNAIDREWSMLPEDEQEPSIDGVAPFLAHQKRHKRETTPALWKYIQQRRWKLLPPSEAPAGKAAPGTTFMIEGGPEFRALALAHAVAGREPPRVYRDSKRDASGVSFTGHIPNGADGLAQFVDAGGNVNRDEWVFLYARDPRLGHHDDYAAEVARDKAKIAAWRDRVREWLNVDIRAALVRRPDRIDIVGLVVPSEWPPPKHGEPTAATATGPPTQPAESLMTNEDYADMAGAGKPR